MPIRFIQMTLRTSELSPYKVNSYGSWCHHSVYWSGHDHPIFPEGDPGIDADPVSYFLGVGVGQGVSE